MTDESPTHGLVERSIASLSGAPYRTLLETCGKNGNSGEGMIRLIKIIVEKHPDGYVAYPVGLKGVVVAQGDTYEEALADARSAVGFHIETFGSEVFAEDQGEVLEVFVAEAAVVA